MAQVQYAGQYEIETCQLITSSGNTLNLIGSLVEINIFEDIYSSALKGSIICADTNNIISKAQVLGQDYIRLKIRTPGFDDEVFDFTENVFCVYKIGSQGKASENAEIFELSFVSPEALKNQRITISKSFVGSPSQIFESIMRDDTMMASKKELFIERAKGNKKHVVPNIRPFQFIKQLMNDAISLNDDNPIYLFYENTKGYHFRSIASLYNEDTRQDFNIGSPGEYIDAGSKLKDIEKEYRTVHQHQVNNGNDMFKNIVSGLLASKLKEVDIFNKEVRTKEYKYLEDFDKHVRIENDKSKDNPIYVEQEIDDEGNLVDSFTDARISVHPVQNFNEGDPIHYNTETKDYTYTVSGIKDTLQHRFAKIIELSSTLSMTMKTNGHTALSCGDTINFTKPDAKNKEGGYIDELMTGKYLITQLRHCFSIITQRHEAYLNVSKDSHPSAKENEYSIVEPKSSPKGIHKF
jgi:hypothetical protein